MALLFYVNAALSRESRMSSSDRLTNASEYFDSGSTLAPLLFLRVLLHAEFAAINNSYVMFFSTEAELRISGSLVTAPAPLHSIHSARVIAQLLFPIEIFYKFFFFFNLANASRSKHSRYKLQKLPRDITAATSASSHHVQLPNWELKMVESANFAGFRENFEAL